MCCSLRMNWTVGASGSPLNSRKTCRKRLWCLLGFFLLLLGTQEQMFDQIKLFSQKKRIRFSAIHLPWQWILKVLETVTRVFPVHPLCSCYTSAPLLRKGCASAWSRVRSSWKGAEWEGCCTVDCLPSLSLTLSQSLSSGIAIHFPYFFLINFILWLLSAQRKFFASSSL